MQMNRMVEFFFIKAERKRENPDVYRKRAALAGVVAPALVILSNHLNDESITL